MGKMALAASLITDVIEEHQAKVKANPKACTHFFGGEMGCTMGDGCRFLHAL